MSDEKPDHVEGYGPTGKPCSHWSDGRHCFETITISYPNGRLSVSTRCDEDDRDVKRCRCGAEVKAL